ncbi:TetR family transcriptional regulator [Xylophilus rhododendri]|uniref:TetR family transcriptional regulator n=1 Tax=Xylophilus rhododendri TaxID=2697032 RepID=A0A857JDY1_9BURK|nr:TetR/AcrR family transcriptional regulator [Xylophilus rhododendri]QHJ01330.1 TetR family transcriptional regulator [Xylophilus rhododendri]
MSRNRPKEPDLLRSRILAATQAVLLQDGLAALTQEKVLARLDISKGGLQHHFRTKQAMLDGLFSAMFEQFVLQYRQELGRTPEGPARHIQAYVRTAHVSDPAAVEAGKALTLLAIGNPQYQQEWAGFLDQMFLADRLEPATHLACRLFADGLWFGCVLGPRPDETLAEAAVGHILGLLEKRP